MYRCRGFKSRFRIHRLINLSHDIFDCIYYKEKFICGTFPTYSEICIPWIVVYQSGTNVRRASCAHGGLSGVSFVYITKSAELTITWYAIINISRRVFTAITSYIKWDRLTVSGVNCIVHAK